MQTVRYLITNWRKPTLMFGFGVGLLIVAVALGVSMFEIWPAVEEVAARGAGEAGRANNEAALTDIDLLLLPLNLKVTEGQAYLLLTMIFGATGAFVHAGTSFTTYVGNRQFKLSWGWWYALRMLIGGAVAVVLVFTALGGLVTLNTNGATIEPQSLNPYTIAGLAGLAGWFSKSAADKLEEVFDALFANSADLNRADKLGPPKEPVVTSAELIPQSNPPTLLLSGQHFSEDLIVRVGQEGEELVPSLQSESVLVVSGDSFKAGELVAVQTADGEHRSPFVAITAAGIGFDPPNNGG